MGDIMSIRSWMEKKIKKLTILDFSVLKLALILLGMVIGAFFPAFVKQYIEYFVVVIIVLYGYLIFRMYK